MGFQIAIDGPAGAGKSTVAKQVAENLRYLYIDTGAMYRAIGLYALDSGVDPADEAAVGRILDRASVDLKLQEDGQHVLLNGRDVNSRIRTEQVSLAASAVSRYRNVRKRMTELQRQIAGEKNVVMDGRDIGTVVFPDAPLKIYLDASVHTRALRRLQDPKAKGSVPDLETVERDIAARDAQDKNREEAPLRRAEDAVYIDSSDMTAGEVTDLILHLAKERKAGRTV